VTLNAFFQVSVSVFCIVATIFMIVLLVWTVMLRIQLSKLIKKLEEISEIAKTTAGETKDFVERSIESLEKFKEGIFTFEFIRRIVTEIIELIKNNTKGAKNGQTK
jgi:hypothetical protein